MIYCPDKWVVVKITRDGVPDLYKVFGSWYGGYLDGDSWRMNSGIERVSFDGERYNFHGFSGSTYSCSIADGSYGIHMYGGGVIAGFQKQAAEVDHGFEIMPEDTDWFSLDYTTEVLANE